MSNWRFTLKACLPALVVFSFLSTVAFAQTSPSSAWDGFHLAVAKADRDAAASVLATDVQIFESGFVERSRDEYLSHHFDEDAKFEKSVARKVTGHREQVAGDMALIMEETESNGSYEGRQIKLIGTETAVLRLRGGIWQVVHIHWSSRKPKS